MDAKVSPAFSSSSSYFPNDNASLAAYVIASIIALLVAGYFYYDNQFKYFKRLGLKNPEPVPVVGNLFGIFTENRMANERKNLAECGKFYGIFHGVQARFVCADPEVLRQICIKDFDKFPNHEMSQFLNDYQNKFIFFLQDDRWKQVRAMQTPTFTSGKIKRMYKLLNVCADDLVDCFGEQLATKLEPIVNLKEIFGLYTMDGIASCGYGLKLERKGSSSIKSAASRNDFVVMALRLFKFNLMRILIAFSINKKLLGWLKFRTTPASEIAPLAQKVQQIIKARRASSRKFDDYLQILLDAKLDDQIELNEMDSKEHHHAGLTHDSLLADQKRMLDELASKQGEDDDEERTIVNSVSSNRMKLSDVDILASAIFLLVVGLETTSTLLTNCTYALAFHQNVQDKLYEEIRAIAELNDDKTSYVFDYDALTSCQYLDAVISETLRALSPVLLLDRLANEDYYLEKYNVTIPKGGKVLLAYHAIMNDPDNWFEPDKFNPDRFMPGQREKIVPGSYCPFGIGPRHCLGMRFSLTEAKLGLAKVLMKYKFEPAPNTHYPPLSSRGLGLNSIKDPLTILKLRA